MSKKVMIFAGEASGDLQGAFLVREMKKIYPNAEYFGVGGFRMREEGVDLLCDSSALGVIGPWGALTKAPYLLRLLRQVKERTLEISPDLVILIDSPTSNMRLAAFAKEHKFKTIYYFPPSAFFYNPERIEKLLKTVDHIVPTFEYTVKMYEKAQIPFQYFGHPLLDIVSDNLDAAPPPEELGIPQDKTIVACLPGSRPQEICSLMPMYVKVMRKLLRDRDDLCFLIPIAMPKVKRLIEKYLKKAPDIPCYMIDGGSYRVLKHARAALLASGSASLEAAIAGVPMIVVYKLTWPDWCFGKLFVKFTYFALPNLVLNRPVVPELLQMRARPSKIVPYLSQVLQDGPVRQKALCDLAEVRSTLGERGVIARFARYIADILDGG